MHRKRYAPVLQQNEHLSSRSSILKEFFQLSVDDTIWHFISSQFVKFVGCSTHAFGSPNPHRIHPRRFPNMGSLQKPIPKSSEELGDAWKHRWNLSCEDFLRCCTGSGVVFLFTQSGDGVFLLNHRNSWYNWPNLHHIFISWANQVTHLGDPVTKAGWWFHPLNGPPWTPDENGSIRPNW